MKQLLPLVVRAGAVQQAEDRLLESLALALQLGAKRVEEARRRRGAVREAGAENSCQRGAEGLQVLGHGNLGGGMTERQVGRIRPVRAVAAPARLTADEPRAYLGVGRHRSPRELLLDRLHRPVRNLFELLRDGGQRRVSQARQDEIVEAGDGDVLGHAQAPLAQQINRSGGHLVVGRDDTVNLHAAREDLLHRHLAELARK